MVFNTGEHLTHSFLFQGRYRIMVEILNENDNMPYFLEDTIQPRYISEVNSGPFLLQILLCILNYFWIKLLSEMNLLLIILHVWLFS